MYPEWIPKLYSGIFKLGQRTNTERIFFDLNPQNRSRFSHQWAHYIAEQLGLVEQEQFTYELNSLETKYFKTKRKELLFKLINPEWTEFQIVKDKHNNNPFFLESVMKEPRNKSIEEGLPDLVYDKGYVIGKQIQLT